MQKGIIKNVNKLTGEPIDAKDLASMLSGIIGNESGVLTVFDELRLEKISDNKVRLHSGVYSLKGHILYIPKGSYEDFEIESGTLGANRIDLLVAEYVKNGEGDGEDTLRFRVIKGEATSGTPQEPDLIQQDISENGITYQQALYKITINGINLNIQASDIKILNIQALKNKIIYVEEEAKSNIYQISNRLSGTRIFSGIFEVSSDKYPKPIPTAYLPRYGMIKISWVKNNANNDKNSFGEAIFSVFGNKTEILYQKVDGKQPIYMSIAPDGKTPQFNQTTGYWARISYVAEMNL